MPRERLPNRRPSVILNCTLLRRRQHTDIDMALAARA
jgi:hypothetical protein